MENKIRINALLDFYAPLLTEKQRQICEYYFREDLSLQEIAETEEISRAAVYDTVRRCRKELESYEEKLHLYRSYRKRMKLYDKIRKAGNEEVNALIEECVNTEND